MSKMILHLDDEEAIRDIVGEVLKAQGYRVLSVATPRDAIAAAREEVPNLVISDLQLEEADGLQTIAQLRAIKATLPVILLTGVLIDPRLVRDTVGKLVSSYIEKTRPLSDIVDEVVRLIGPA
ncbi:MAG: response regulator [Opitutae bacterium]